MRGIVSYGAYVPVFRLDRNLIANAWGRNSMGGERSVANNDEDTVTMSVAAATNCLNGKDRKKVEGFFFNSNTAPYKEKMNSTLIATALDLRLEIATADFAHSLRAGTGALRAALSSVESGAAIGLDGSKIALGVMDGLTDLEKVSNPDKIGTKAKMPWPRCQRS